MNRQASVLLNFINSSISDNSLALQDASAQRSYYQRLIYFLLSRSIYTAEGIQLLGRQLADIARDADFARQIDAVEQASQIMLALPISGPLKSVAHHYQALCAKRKGDYDGARRLLERVAEKATPQYRARALQVIGSTYHEQGKIEMALPFYIAAGKAASDCDLSTLVESQRNIAIIHSIQGDHSRALLEIENLFPLVRLIAKRYPLLYYSFLNSLAVELGELGRINEAESACSIVLASPFAAIYTEIAQTRDELAAKRTAATPSIVAITVAPKLALPVQPSRKVRQSRSLAINWLARAKISFQRSRQLIVAVAATALIGTIQNFFDRLRHSINPRSPPSYSAKLNCKINHL